MTICAWRPRRHHNGVLVRNLVVRTTTLALMWRWLARTARTRQGFRRTLWIDDEAAPAVVVMAKRRRPRWGVYRGWDG